MSRMGKKVVYVNPVNMGSDSWELYITETRRSLERGEVVKNLVCQYIRFLHLLSDSQGLSSSHFHDIRRSQNSDLLLGYSGLVELFPIHLFRTFMG